MAFLDNILFLNRKSNFELFIYSQFLKMKKHVFNLRCFKTAGSKKETLF